MREWVEGPKAWLWGMGHLSWQVPALVWISCGPALFLSRLAGWRVTFGTGNAHGEAFFWLFFQMSLPENKKLLVSTFSIPNNYIIWCNKGLDFKNPV